MIKKLILLGAILISIVFFSVISVDERENVVATNIVTKHKQLLTQGLHFAWPGIVKVDYIFMNQRNAAFTSIVSFSDMQAEVSSIVVWQVADPLTYIENIKRLSVDGLNKAIAEHVLQIVTSRAQSTNLSTFNQLNNLLAQPLALNELGITVNSISPSAVNVITKVSESAVQPVVSNTESPVPAEHPQIMQVAIESAYYEAQMIKTGAEIKQAKMLQILEVKDPQFYAYFRKLQIYKDSAKSKQDMPPLEDLIK